MIKEFLKINLASPEKILKWTERLLPNGKLVGKITKIDMINSETLKPSFDGLFCEKIFGPIKDFECSCNRYKKIQLKEKKRKQIFICSKCSVELSDSKMRNYRMG